MGFRYDAPPKAGEINKEQSAWFQRHGTKLLAGVIGLAMGIMYGRRRKTFKAD